MEIIATDVVERRVNMLTPSYDEGRGQYSYNVREYYVRYSTDFQRDCNQKHPNKLETSKNDVT